jgi:hypothetical protein
MITDNPQERALCLFHHVTPSLPMTDLVMAPPQMCPEVQARILGRWSPLLLAACLGACDRTDRDMPGSASSAASTTSTVGSTSIPSAVPSPPTPEERTREIARLWAFALPSYEHGARMCAIFEGSDLERRPALDAWGTPLDVRCDGSALEYRMRSAGSDRHILTSDDIEMIHQSGSRSPFRPYLPFDLPRGPRPLASSATSH